MDLINSLTTHSPPFMLIQHTKKTFRDFLFVENEPLNLASTPHVVKRKKCDHKSLQHFKK